MKTLPLTQGRVAIVDDEDHEFLSQWKWSVWTSGRKPYAGRYEGRKLVLMHRVLNGTAEGMLTDHIDCDTLNNRRSNLRDATPLQNVMNKVGKRGGTSRFKGVWFDRWQKGAKQWRTAIRLSGKLHYLGWFASEQEAGAAYASAARHHFGEFANIRKGQIA
jgi:hypothetical protein